MSYFVQEPLLIVLIVFHMIYVQGNRAEGHISIILIKVLRKGGCYNVLNGFTEDTGKRDRPVICRV